MGERQSIIIVSEKDISISIDRLFDCDYLDFSTVGDQPVVDETDFANFAHRSLFGREVVV